MTIIYEPKGKAREYSALAANLYRGCSHGCVYCYAPSALRMRADNFHAHPGPRKNILKQLEKDCQKNQYTYPILLSFTTDPYQPIEEEFRLTHEAIKILKKYGNRVEILTKGGMLACRDFELLDSDDAFATTLTFLDPLDSVAWEPKASSPNSRIGAMMRAHERGIKVWASLEPVIDPAQTLELIKRTAPFVDLFKVGKLNYHPRAKEIDWHGFGHQAVSLLEKLGKAYYVKKDLKILL